MEFQLGDWVRTDSGLKGRVVDLNDQSSLVELLQDAVFHRLAFSHYRLTRIEPPNDIDCAND
jgi:preprotein translocase subunit YajC